MGCIAIGLVGPDRLSTESVIVVAILMTTCACLGAQPVRHVERRDLRANTANCGVDIRLDHRILGASGGCICGDNVAELGFRFIALEGIDALTRRLKANRIHVFTRLLLRAVIAAFTSSEELDKLIEEERKRDGIVVPKED